MKIGKDRVVQIVYEMAVGDQTVEKCTEENPLDYIHGTGSLLKNFEERIEGLEPGQEFSFSLSPAEGHGEYDPARVLEIPKDAFVIDGNFREDLIVVGNIIPLMGSDGVVVRGVITEVGQDSVTIDTNNRFAGQEMSFRGKVLSVREATAQELEEGLRGELLHRGCGGCHGQCHGDGCHGEGGGCHGSDCDDGGCHGEGCHCDGEGSETD